MRLAGSWRQYSKNAMPQLAMMTFQRASLRYFRWPYHAKVMKIFSVVRSKMVRTNPPSERDAGIRTSVKDVPVTDSQYSERVLNGLDAAAT